MDTPLYGSAAALILTVEAKVVETPKFHALFTEEELAICRRRLQDYGYQPTSRAGS